MTAPQLQPGAVIAGKYQVAALLGQGGSSNTYYCRAGGNREVVVKMFDPALRQRADVMGMVEQVYGMTNALPGDSVVRLVDAGYEPQTGGPFSVTERVPAPSLAQALGQRAMTPEETAGMLRALAHVMDGAHQQNLFHHALKPTNIFVASQPQIMIRVMDFGAGLARLAVPTQEGYALAAPWLAPEQAQQGMQAGAQADVFAAALCAFFALTGRSYWRSCQGQVDLANWQRELMSPRDMASVRAQQLGVSIPQSIDAVFSIALSPDPSQRYRSLGELAGSLENLLASKGQDPAATMAFPQSAAEYPPPPAPMGGGQPGAGGYGGRPPGASDIGPSGQGPAYGAMAQSAGAPDARPGPTGAPASSNKLVPIVVIAVVVLLLGGAVAAFVFMGRKPVEDGPVAVGAASSDSAAPAPADSAAPPADAPTSTAEAEAPAPSGSAAAGATEVEVTLKCDPDCEEIKIDDKPLEDISKPAMLPPGKHRVYLTKAGFFPQSEIINLEAGKKFEKQYHLVPKATAAGGAKAPCGKFLKRCN